MTAFSSKLGSLFLIDHFRCFCSMHANEREREREEWSIYCSTQWDRRNIMNICKQGPHLCFAFECQRREAKDQRRNKTILSLLSWPYRWKRELFLRVGSILAFSDYILVFYCYLLRKEPSKRGQYHLCLLFHSFLWMWIHTKTMHACTWSHVTVSRPG